MILIDELDKALAPLGLTFFNGFYEGTDIEYGVYDELKEIPALFGDNDEDITVGTGRAHIYVRTERDTKKKTLKNLLKSAGFVLGDTYEDYESDTDYTHFMVEFEKILN